MATINTFTDYDAQKQDIERRRKMAEMLQQQSMQPLDTNQTAGGYVVPVSWTQGLAKMLQAYSGRKGLDEAEGRSKELSAQRNQALAEAIRGMPQGTPGTAGVPEQEFQPTGADYADNPNLATNEQGMVNVPAQAGAPAQPASWQDQAAWMGKLGQIGPDATQIGSTILGMQQKDVENAENRQARLEQARLTREGHMLQLQARLMDSRLSAKDKADTARELQMMRDQSAAERQKERLAAEQRMRQFAIENRQPQQPQPLVQVMGPDGKEVWVERKDAVGKQPAGPGSKAQKASEGKDLLQSELDNLRTNYKVLNDSKAIPSSARSGISNAASWVQSSPIGQLGGRILATKEQDARNNIQSARLRLMNAIKTATGMSAQQLNSNIELKTWLDSLTDPNKSYESNAAIIDAIENTYLKGGGGSGATGSFGDTPPPGAVREKHR